MPHERISTIMLNNKLLNSKYGHAWVFLYAFIYIPGFFFIEQMSVTTYNLIYSPIDDLIPFCELFVIPYYIWFPYMLIVFLYIFFTSKEEFYKIATLIISGMTLFLIISMIYPNAHQLRPEYFERDNILTKLVTFTYSIDTPTNILPSIHVYNSIGCHIGVMKSERLKDNHWIRRISFLISISIVLSTVFIKQHSIIDGILALLFICIMYFLIYIIYPKTKHATHTN